MSATSPPSLWARLLRRRGRFAGTSAGPRDHERDLEPPSGAADQTPPGEYRLAASYLLPEARLKRCVETIEAFAGPRGGQRLEVELRPPDDGGEEAWYLPLLFFGKDPVAPDLEIHDRAGAVVPAPTKLENQALTERAFDELAAEIEFDLDSHPDLRALIHDVIFRELLPAQLSRRLIEERVELPPPLHDLLIALEDQFVLWVRVEVGAAEARYLITRSLTRNRLRFLRRRLRRERFQIDTAIGPVTIALGQPSGRPFIPLRQVFDRLLLALGTHIITFTHATNEAPRFASFHMRATAPAGFTVRQVVADGSFPGAPILARSNPALLTSEQGLTVQGNESTLGHIHLSRPRNPARLQIRIALALRSDLISFWAAVVVLTAILLWLFHRAGVRWIDERGGALETATTILLIVPGAASALALRAEEGGLVRHTMSLTRTTLFASALLSISTALVLLLPALTSTREQLVGDFATAAYFLAVIISVSWVLGRPWVWALYQRLLDTRVHNFLAIAVFSVGMVLTAHFDHFAGVLTAALLIVAGLGFAAIATNRMLNLRGIGSGLFVYLAACGSLIAFAVAGIFAGYYDNHVSRAGAAWFTLRAGILIALLALLGACRTERGVHESR